MTSWFSGRLRHRNNQSSFQRRSCRLQLETLETREVASATSWFDSYHPALVSAPGQERRADGVAFAIGNYHTLLETTGAGAGPALEVGTRTGAVDFGYAQDISAGRDFYGFAQCLVHGKDNNVLLYSARTTRWTDLHFYDTTHTDVAQISAGENGTIFVLDTRNCVWEFSGGHWTDIRSGVREIQAGRNFFDGGVFIRDIGLRVWHSDVVAGTTYVWEELALPYSHAHALSVDANNHVFILDDDKHILEWHWKDGMGHDLRGYWEKLDDSQAIAIDACADRVKGVRLYAAVPDTGDWEGNGLFDFPSQGTGVSARWWAITGAGWKDTGIVTDQFSGAGGTTTVYAGLYEPGSLVSDWYVESIDWAGHHKHYACPTLPGLPF
jgi:hypothetical protein